MNLKANQKGFVVTIITFSILIIMITIALSISALIFSSQRIATNSVKSNQSYYAAESGIEDALLRLKNNPQLAPLSYNLSVASTTASVNIPSIVGGSRAIVSEGNYTNIKRKIQTIYSIDSDAVSFFYGAQVGDGGLTMNNGSRIVGNVFSNGNISGGSGTITNDAIVAGNGHSIDDVTVQGNVQAYSCLSPATVQGNLTYVTGGTRTCTVNGSISTQSTEIALQPLPISQVQITDWKTEAAAGGTISGSVTLTNGATQSLGPVKITGSLTVDNGATLTMTGTIYVIGNIVVSNNATVKLDSSYGSLGGVLLSDGTINIDNNGILLGSGQTGSYILILSTNIADPAINIKNNATGAIFYTSAGGIEVNNNAGVKELVGYKVKLDNNAVLEYETGLANVNFASGPSGGWKVVSWEEK